MLRIINLFADEFGNHAILKGGMELRLADCPRFTNDLDYVFVPYSSKKEIKDRLLDALKSETDLSVSCGINSKCIRCVVARETVKVQIEVNVSAEIPSSPLSTSSLARAANVPPRIIRGMDFRHALSHKLAAWNERGLVRDLFDVYYIAVHLMVSPDVDTLVRRLGRVETGRKNARASSMPLDEFIAKIESAASALTGETVEDELRDYLAPEELPGLDRKIAGGIRKVIDFLREKSKKTT
jgi:predicted nucleotidyltransferase component of viral defense system